MIRAWVGLGANLGDPAATLDAALAAIDHLPDTRVLATSGYYLTPPWGDTDQPEFTNAVAVIETGLAASDLLTALLAIECERGRVRGSRRWGPRAIDLDLLLYGQQIIVSPDLTVPHPRMRERAFVLVPLVEISPEIVVPGQGRAAELLAALGDDERSGIRPGPKPGFKPAQRSRKQH